MQLRDACVDVDGNLVVQGKLSFPVDDRCLFRLPEHAQLRVTRCSAFEVMRISASEAERDAQTGFYDRADRGPDVWLPPAIAEMVRHTLRFGDKVPDSRTLVGQHGVLAVSANQTNTNIRQPVSNWRINTGEKDGNISFRVSADLLRTRARDVTDKGADNYWSPVAGVSPRLLIDFRVDPSTRVACFGALVPGGECLPGPPPLARTSLDNLRLESAMVGSLEHMVATDADGRWLSLRSTERTFEKVVLEKVDTPRRLVSGFVPAVSGTPRLRFYGISLDYVARNMRECRLKVAFDGDCGLFIEGLARDLEEVESLHRPIRKAEYVFELTLSGLRFAYRVMVTNQTRTEETWIDGAALLAWEVLILRYPAFLRHRAAVKSAAHRSMSTDEA